MTAPASGVSHLGSFQPVALPLLGCGPFLHGPGRPLQLLLSQPHPSQWGSVEEKVEGKFLAFKDRAQKLHTTLPSICHWPEFGHVVAPTCKGVWEVSSFAENHQPNVFWGIGSACELFRATWS